MNYEQTDRQTDVNDVHVYYERLGNCAADDQ